MKQCCITVIAVVLLAIAVQIAGAGVAPNAKWGNTLRPKGRPAPAITLASDGKTDYVVLLPGKPTTEEEKAASDLALWLKEMTGAEFPVVRETGAASQPAKLISVGRTAAASTNAVVDSGLGKEGYAIAVKGGNVFLVGGSVRGPINAVYALLEEDLGCRWFARDTSTIPQTPKLVAQIVPRRFVPTLEIRDPFYWDAFDGTWSLRNRTNSPYAGISEEFGGNVNYAAGLFVHTFNRLVPPDTYYKDHPEYFSENDGKRNPNQLCVSNPEVLAIVIDRVKSILKDSPDAELISVSQNDGYPCCACPKCKAVFDAEGSISGPLLLFVNSVADAIAKDYPDVKISTLAYLDTYQPPKTIKPRSNVAIQLCTDRHAWAEPFLAVPETQQFQNAMKGWAAIGADIDIWDYTVNFSHYLAPMPNMQVVAEDIRFFFAHNAKGIMLQGGYQGPGTADGAMKSWVWAKQLWDPTLDTRTLVRDFTYGYFGAAAEPIQQYQDMLWKIWEKNHHGSLAHLPDGCRYPMSLPIFSRDFLDKTKALFSKAEKLSMDMETLRRVQIAELPIIYVEIDQLYNRLTKVSNPEESARMLELLTRFETIAHDEKVAFLAEGAPNTDEWIARLRNAVRQNPDESRQWSTKVGTGEVSVLRIPARWRFSLDAKDSGVKEKWFSETWDDSAWGTCRTDLNNGWEGQGFTEPNPNYGWYRLKLKLPNNFTAKHLYIYFGAADEDAWVYINGKLSLEHSFKTTGLRPEQIWNTPFFFDAVTDLKPGSMNTLAVRVYNSAGMGGLWKPVYLIASDSELDLAGVQSAAAAEPKE